MLFSGGANTKNIIKYSQLQVSTSQLDIPIALFWGQRRISPNCVWYSDFQSHKQSAGKGGGKATGYTYSASLILGLGEGVMSSPLNVWGPSSTTTVTTLAKLGLAFMSGTSSQAVWSYLTSNHPSQALAYMDTAYVYGININLGSSASVPDYGFEIQRLNGFSDTLTAPGWTNPSTGGNTPGSDVSLADVIPDFLINSVYGMGFASGDIDSSTLAQFHNYQSAQGLYFSPCLTSQEKATQIIDRWATLGNTWIYWSGSALMFVPLGDSPLTGNGHTYSPDLTAAYSLGLEDFIVGKSGGVPVEEEIQDPADCYNRTVLEICDRTRGYVASPVEYKDQQLVSKYGLRDNSSTQANDICNPAVGAICAQLIGKRAAYVRRTFKFTLNYRYVLLLPGSIVTLTEPNIGLANYPVRIRTIEEDKDFNLAIEAEELPAAIGTYFSQNTPPAVVATTPSTLVDPGPVNVPAVCEPASNFAQGQSVLLVAASGGANWGGANVWLSLDGTNFNEIGTLEKPALQGTLTASLAAYSSANPDTTDTLSVDATQSQGVWPSVSNANAQNATSLCYVSPQPVSSGGNEVLSNAGELLAFGAQTPTGTYAANLTYLERGLYGTGGIAHAIGEQFTLFDVSGKTGSTLSYDLPANYIGQTLYLKFQSFNIFGEAAEDLSTCTVYEYIPSGISYGTAAAGVPSQPTGFGGTVQSSQVLLSWNANPAIDNVASYAVYRGNGTSTAFASCAQVWAGQTLTFTDTDVDLVSGYTYYVVAINEVGDSIPSTGFNATTYGINNGQVLQSGSFSGVGEASIDFNPQVLACGFLEITLWNLNVSNNGDAVRMKFRASGADMSGVTYITSGVGANSGGGASGIGGSSATSAIMSGALSSGISALLNLKLFRGGTGNKPIGTFLLANVYSDGTTLEMTEMSLRTSAALSANPDGLSFLPSSANNISFSYAIRGFLAS